MGGKYCEKLKKNVPLILLQISDFLGVIKLKKQDNGMY